MHKELTRLEYPNYRCTYLLLEVSNSKVVSVGQKVVNVIVVLAQVFGLVH